MPAPPPRVSIFGFAWMEVHFGMCRSAAIALNLRPQWGQGTRSSNEGSAAVREASAPPPSDCASLAFRPARSAAWKFADSRFHLGTGRSLGVSAGKLDLRSISGRLACGSSDFEPDASLEPPPPAREGGSGDENEEEDGLREKESRRGAGECDGDELSAHRSAEVRSSRCRDESQTLRACELTATFSQMARCTCNRSDAKERPQHGHGTTLDGRRDGSSSYGSSPA
mmetsp:Transcript_3126/g.8929  ORF Transcript_3126/g.8929 Transcript_3126/m.8929 type:complete len:226 (+) Transcript_3126:1882-2559(+)